MHNDTEDCYLEETSTDTIRMLISFGLGSTMCVLGICLNSLLLIVFSRLSFRNNNYLYLYILAFFDIIVETCFILIFSVSSLYDYFQNYELYVAWHNYLRLVSTIGQVLILASTMIIVAASFERYICSGKVAIGFNPLQRMFAIGGVVVYALAVKGTVFIELKVVHNAECDKFYDWHIHQSELADPEGLYSEFWMFYCRNILSVFLPFTLLTFLNLATIKNLNQKSKHFESILLDNTQLKMLHLPPEAAMARQRKRDATRTLAVLVSVYLITNLINVILTFWEHIDKRSLMTLGDGWPYKYLADVSSFLTISATAVRLPIYYCSNRELRQHFVTQLKECLNGENVPLKEAADV